MFKREQSSSSSGFDGGASSSKVRKYYYDTNKRTLLRYIAQRNWKLPKNYDLTQMARNHPPFMRQLNLMKKLPVHDGCVNTICWNKTGEYILSGSDDCNLCITKPLYLYDTGRDYTVLHKVLTRHLGNIFSAQFLPNTGDTKIVSCCSRGLIKVHDIHASDPSSSLLSYNCHKSTVYDVVVVPDDDNIFLSCGEDKTVRLFDMRIHTNCARADTCSHSPLIRNSHAMTTLCLHPLNANLMLIGRADGIGLVYDRRKLPDMSKVTPEASNGQPFMKYRHPLDSVVGQFDVPSMDSRYRFTSLCYNKKGDQVLASYSGEYLYLFNHDTSSNMELVSTLPKRPPKSDDNSHGQNSTNGDSSDQGSNSSDRASSDRMRRLTQIRLRGDWSDTGINSVPRSRMQRSTTEALSVSAAFVEHVVLSSRSRNSASLGNEDTNDSSGQQQRTAARSGSRTTVIPTSHDTSNSSDNLDNHTSPRIISRRRTGGVDRYQPINENDDDDGADNDDAHRAVDDDDHDDHESVDNGDDDEDDDNDDDDDDDDDEVYTVIDYNEGDSSATSQERLDDSSSSGGLSHGARLDSSESDSSSAQASRRRSLIKEKFKKTIDSLKDKYSHIPVHKPSVKYQGHRNSRTSIKEAIFWGDEFIMSGSDCGRIFVWEKESAKIVMAFKADERVVNCLAPNPYHYVLASSGIDYDIKLWSTQSLVEGPLLVSDRVLNNIVENNEIMLEESKHTFAVPPHLFFRVLASLARS